MCRRQDVLAVNGYPETYFMYGEDTEFCMSMLQICGKKTLYLGSSQIIHLGGYSESKVLNSRKPTVVTKTGLYFVKKYRSAANLLTYKILLFCAAFMKHMIFSVKCLFSKQQKNLNGKTKWGATWKTILRWRGELN